VLADPWTETERAPPATVAEAPNQTSRQPRWRIEQLPKSLLCVPLVLHWFWLAARYRSLTLPSCLNPRIETGGLAGESKSACLAQIAPSCARWVAPWRLVSPGENALLARTLAGLDYPLIAKPDIGWCGHGVRRIASDAELRAYADACPPQAAIILQRLITAPHEAGLLYIRPPGAPTGTLAAMTFRHTPAITGDGQRSIATLIKADPRLRPHAPAYAAALGSFALARMPAAGERVVLTTIASLRIGARYEDATARITPTLTTRIDDIARSMGDFHYGRFDVRFTSLAALQAGDFSIIEVNGAGSEAIQFWDPTLGIAASFRGVFAKQAQIFALGAAMRGAGHNPVGVVALSRAWLRQQRLLKGFPSSN
jgi:hypothetical protein